MLVLAQASCTKFLVDTATWLWRAIKPWVVLGLNSPCSFTPCIYDVAVSLSCLVSCSYCWERFCGHWSKCYPSDRQRASSARWIFAPVGPPPLLSDTMSNLVVRWYRLQCCTCREYFSWSNNLRDEGEVQSTGTFL